MDARWGQTIFWATTAIGAVIVTVRLLVMTVVSDAIPGELGLVGCRGFFCVQARFPKGSGGVPDSTRSRRAKRCYSRVDETYCTDVDRALKAFTREVAPLSA